MKERYKVNFINSLDEYEGYFSFFMPESDHTILARYLGPEYIIEKGAFVCGDFSIDSDIITPTELEEEIRQKQEYNTDTKVMIIGTIINIDGTDCVIQSQGISIEASPENMESFSVGDRVIAYGQLDFCID